MLKSSVVLVMFLSFTWVADAQERPSFVNEFDATYQSNDYAKLVRLEDSIINYAIKLEGYYSILHLNMLGVYYNAHKQLEDTEGAVRVGEESLKLLKKMYQDTSLTYLNMTLQLIKDAETLGNCAKINKFSDYLLLSQKKRKESSAYTGMAFTYKARCYKKELDFESTIRCLSMAKDVYASSLGDTSQLYIMALNDLAIEYSSSGYIHHAKRFQEECISLFSTHHDTLTQNYARILSSMGYLYFGIDENEKAENCFSRAQNIWKLIHADFDEAYLAILNGKISALEAQEKYEEAIELAKWTARLSRVAFGEESDDYSKRLNTLAIALNKGGNVDEALEKMEEAIAICIKNHGSSYYETVNTIGNKARILFDAERYDEAILAFEECTAYGRKIEEKEKTVHELDYYYLAQIDRTLNRGRASGYFQVANKLISGRLNEAFKYQTAEEKYQYLQKKQRYFSATQSFLKDKDYSNTGLVELTANNTIRMKGIILNSSKNIIKELSSLKSSDIKMAVATYRSNHRTLESQLILPLEERTINVDSLKQIVNREEGELLRAYHEQFPEAGAEYMTWQHIASKLKIGEVSIEFSAFEYIDNKGKGTDQWYYLAYVIKPDANQPIVIELFEEKELTDLMKKMNIQGVSLRGAVAEEGNSEINAASYYDLIWSKIDPIIEGAQTIYFAPDGLLHQIPFALLKQDEKILAERYNLQQLSSTYAITSGLRNSKVKDLVLIGGVQYEYDTQGKAIQNDFEVISRGISNTEAWSYLPGTEQEINTLKNTIPGKYQSIIWTGTTASESKFKSLDGASPSVIHIATHGFFFEGGISNTENEFVKAENPLLRSGLLFAGANYTWKNGSNPYEKEDGILTALEISNMDLSNTELVVLSACETGLGDIQGSEGVYGLQRAFKTAGVNKIIMSLWSVPDKETAEFMNLFYTSWFGGETIENAFMNTQREMHKRYPEDSAKWAAFVLLQ